MKGIAMRVAADAWVYQVDAGSRSALDRTARIHAQSPQLLETHTAPL